MPEITITEKTLPQAGQPDTNPANLEFPNIAWQGLFQDYRDLVAETTEAADAFHYAAFLSVLGCTLGRRLHVYHATNLYPNFYICLVGRSGMTRKDTSIARSRDLLNRLHAEDTTTSPSFRIVRGIRSYEGLLDELSGERKVRLIHFGELLSLFSKTKQESVGNIIPQLTELYDCPDQVNPPVHQKEIANCREPFLSIIAGTTQAWMSKALTEREIYGGFANRWMYFHGLPKGPMPNPPKVDREKRDKLVAEINQIRSWADSVENGELTVEGEANNLFTDYYKEFYGRCQREGMIPTLIVRVQDIVWKLALLYAASNLSVTIRKQDLEPALVVGNYLEASITEIFRGFQDTRGKQAESRVLDYLKNQPQGVRFRDAWHNLGLSSGELEGVIGPLVKAGLIQNNYVPGTTRQKIRILKPL